MKQQQERQKLLSKKKIISIVLVLALLIAYIPMNMRAGDSGIVRVADASTMDSWKEIFDSKDISTENAGKVWTDKSVFTDANAFAGTGIAMNKENNFLVALSAIASNIVKEGMTGTPTDTMLILDVSGSMNSSNSDVAEELVDSANESIKELLTVNKYNRVGVVLYSGPTTVSGAASDSDAVLVLPLGRYTTGSDGKYLSYKSSNSSGETISLDSDVKYEGANNGPTSQSKKVVGATYIQKGIILAMNQFTASSNTTTVTDELLGTLKRKPIMVLMSDGAPTISSVNFTNPTSYRLGDGTSSSTSAGQGFLTQLSAAYAKYQIEDKYDTESLFYTLGLGTSSDVIATSVLNPSASTTAINDFWSSYQKASVNGTVTVSGSGYNAKKVTKISAPLEQNYVDKYFQVDKNGSSSLADGLKNAFQEIIGNIELQSKYYPTLISKDEQYSGYISFVDRIGEYMEVKDVKGILINNTLYSGATLAEHFADGKDALGIYETSIADNEMVKAVQNRLGIADLETARSIIKLAHSAGQLSYKNANEYSNYIGWYANAAGEFLGFYQEGVTKLQETDNSDTNPMFTMKSYGYFGAVDEEYGVADTDMMYATVQVQTNIHTGEQTVAFAVPAALVPIVTYNVSFDENSALSGLTVTGADHPIRLVYEVGLEEGINSFNIKDMISAEYAAENSNSDGSLNFYTNQYDLSNTTGYQMVNTYSYFNPSRQNEKYYHMIDTLIYADNKGTLYSGNSKPTGDMYRTSVVYKKDGTKLTTETIYRKIDATVLEGAVQKTGTTNWYIPEGYVNVTTEGSIVNKSVNKTNTLSQSTISFVDTSNHELGDLGYNFYAVSTLGNNGKLTMEPETGIVITKEMKEGVSAPNKSFTFVVTNVSDSRDNNEYPAYFVATDGKAVETSVVFQNGTATVTLKPGEELYIGGMTSGDVIRVEESEEEDYIVESVNGDTALDSTTITIVPHEFGEARFVNTSRGKGNLTIEKDVVHNFGKDYEIPADKNYEMLVTLQGVGTKNATYSASLTNSSLNSVTTDANGQFTITLKYNQQFAMYNLPEGTEVTVVENNPGTGFTPTYKDNGVLGDGTVTIQKDTTASVVVTNSYVAAPVSPTNVAVSGTKTLTGRPWQADDVFTFELQKQIGDNQWSVIGTTTVKGSDADKTFDFNEVFAKEVYSQIGTYHYRVVEVEPLEGAIAGVSYDKHVHTFAVDVTDADMDGKLEVARVWSSQASTGVRQTGANDWLVIVDYTNRYSTSGSVAVTIDVYKNVVNSSNSPLPYKQEFTFGLFDTAGTLVQESEAVTNGEGTRLILEYDQAGTYHYVLKEIHPNSIPAGWTYTEKEVSVTVEVTDTGKGYLEAVIYKGADRPSNANTAISEEFTNIYQPKDAELIIDFVDKEISGRELNDKEFTFELQTTDGSTVLKGTNDKNGKVNFNGTLKFNQVGTYNYQVVETSADGKGVTTDKNIYHIVVTVSDQGGALRASYTIASEEGNRVVFHNIYKPEKVTYVVTGNKILSGRPLLNDEFTFIMKEVADTNGTALSNAKVYTTTNMVDGSFAFDEITYEAAGIYYYQVSEVIGSGNSHGITYDKNTYIVAIEVTDNKEGKLVVADVSYTTQAGNKVDQIIFRNSYVPSPTSAQIPGDKDLTGKVLLEDDFQFEIYVSDANWQTGSLLETVANAADGTFVFTAIDYDKAGSYYYLVKEVNGGKVIDGITYDAATYHVRIDVVDNLEGNLSSTVHIYDAYDVPQESIVFRNVYAISGTGSVTLEGEKILVGRDIVDGEFTFELYDADTEFVIADSVKDTATNTGNTFAFTLTYSPEDIGKTFHYVVKEANSGKVVDGIRYSADRYHIVVVVEDNGVGGIKTTKTITKDSISVTDISFTNECVGNLVIRNEVEYYKENVQLETSLDGREDVEYTITVEFDNGTKETFTLKDGESKLFENILYGTTYKVTEDTTGAVYTNTITNGEGVIDSPVTNVDVLNRYDYYPVNPGFLLIKMDKDATKLLEGAIFGLYGDAECTIEVAQIESNAEGQMFFTVPDAGTYYLKEIQAPEGYLLSDEVYEVTAQYKYTEIFPTEEGESTTPYIEQLITVEIEGLELNEGKFEITAYNVTNDPIPPKPPVDDPIKNTGDSIVLQILALSLLLAGMAVVVTATRLRRKETTK